MPQDIYIDRPKVEAKCPRCNRKFELKSYNLVPEIKTTCSGEVSTKPGVNMSLPSDLDKQYAVRYAGY